MNMIFFSCKIFSDQFDRGQAVEWQLYVTHWGPISLRCERL